MIIIITKAMNIIMLKVFLIVTVIILLTSVSFAQVEIGQLVPDFSYLDTNGETHSLSEYRGKVLFLALIGYGCPFCRAEAPSTETNIWQKYKSDSFQALGFDTWNGSLRQAITYVNLIFLFRRH